MSKSFIVRSKDLFNKAKNPKMSLSPEDILRNKKIRKYKIKEGENMRINFIIEDYRCLSDLLEQAIILANKKRYYFRMIVSGGDDYVIAYSGERFSEKQALAEYNKSF